MARIRRRKLTLMRLLTRYLVAHNDNRLYDQPYDDVRDERIELENRIEDWYVCRRITTLFGFADQRGMIFDHEAKRKKANSTTKATKTLDLDLDAKLRKLLGL